MLWTACCGSVLGFRRAFLTNDAGSIALLLVYVPGVGAALAACALAVPWNRAGVRFPKQPGEWILVLTGATLLFSVLMGVGLRFGHQRPHVVLDLLLSTSWFYLIPLAVMRAAAWWKVAFAALLVENVLSALAASLRIAGRYSEGWGWVVAVALTAAAIADLRRDLRYRWTHWVGVGFAWLTYLLAASQSLYN